MSLESGCEWVEGDEWRIDWVGKWSPAGVDAEGYVYTDTDWQEPSPYPYGHPDQPKYPPARFQMGYQLDSDSDAGDTAVLDDEEEDHLTGLEVRNIKAETRRRRWLRRAIYVGKTDK